MPCGCKKQTAMQTQVETEAARKLAAERQRRRAVRQRQVADAAKTAEASGRPNLRRVS